MKCMPTPTPPPRIIAGYEPGARKYYLTVPDTPLIEVEPLFRRGYKLSTTLATTDTDTLTKSRLA